MNWSALIDKPLKTALRKYSLRRDEAEVVFSNKKCSIKFWDSDYQTFKWVFFNPNAKHVYYYYVSKYIDYILNSKIPSWININKADTLEEFTVEIFKYYNDIIIDYLDKPLNGDFTWHQSYI